MDDKTGNPESKGFALNFGVKNFSLSILVRTSGESPILVLELENRFG